uniref:Pollen Ole e 1 allergen and extensin family protein n=1 Tax=Parastrongyloides trichosuri TaxID=131310 RepID=A0A0N4ZGG3_PARTI
MVSKAALFAVVIILNLTALILSTRFLISGTLRCNKSGFPGAKVSVCDGQSERNPKEIATSDNNGYFRLDAQISNSESIYRVSIYHNCTRTTSERVEEKIYTKQINYGASGMSQAQQSSTMQAPLTIPDLLDVEYRYDYVNCSATKN